MHRLLPNHLRPRREKIFGPAPSHPLDRNAKARVWGAANAYNAQHKQPRQHWGPLTKSYMLVLKVLLWRFHGADGGGRCFPSFERIAAAAKVSRDTAIEAVKALEVAGLLTWVNRITRIRCRERDLLGQLVTVWQVIRTSNAYRFIDPLGLQPGRRSYKSENPTGPQNRDLKTKQAPLTAAPLTPKNPQPSRLSPADHAALIARQDAGIATKADWALYARQLDAMLAARA